MVEAKRLALAKGAWSTYEAGNRIVSYNYDVILESTIGNAVGRDRLLYNPQQSRETLRVRTAQHAVLLKPHGSIAWQPYASIGLGLPPNPWLQDEPKGWSIIGNSPMGQFVYPPGNDLYAPDLVPPGHSAVHLLDVTSDVVPAIHQVIESCDALIVCGFSANYPDDAEADRYFSKLRPDIPVIHIDLKAQDGKTEAQKILQRYTSRYEFMPAENLPELISRLDTALGSSKV